MLLESLKNIFEVITIIFSYCEHPVDLMLIVMARYKLIEYKFFSYRSKLELVLQLNMLHLKNTTSGWPYSYNTSGWPNYHSNSQI